MSPMTTTFRQKNQQDLLREQQLQQQKHQQAQMAAQRKQHIAGLQRRMRSLKNQMDFLEIFSNFWPFGNMNARVDRMEQEMQTLNSQFDQVARM